MHFEVQNFCFFCPCAGLVHFEVQNMCFFVPVQVWCTLQLEPSVCFVPVEVGMTHGLLSKCLISKGIGSVCLKVMFSIVFAGFLTQVFFQNNTF